MSLSKNMSVKKNLDTNNETISSLTKPSNNPVVRINQDSDDNLQALFDSVLNPNDSKRPLQVPFRMRKLPNSFFNPPSQARPTNTSHSRTNSVDSAYDAGSQGSVNQSPSIGSTAIDSTNAGLPPNPQGENKLTIFHSRAHSSPASLQQSYTVQAKSINSENAQCSQINSRTSFADNLTFPQIVERNAASSEADQRNLSAKPGVPNQAFHMKQRSYNVISPIQLYNELGDLPPGWEQARTNDGQIYYLNHNTKSTQWEDPRIQVKQNLLRANQQPVIQNETNQVSADISKINDSLGPLPEGWEQAFTESGDVYFINHVNRTTSWNDPRIPDFLQKSVKIAKPELHWINVRDVDKDREICKPKLEASGMNASAAPLQVDPFLSGDNHTRQESSDSGLSLSSNTFAINTNDFLPNIDDSMDCISDNDLNGMDCPEHLVSSLQIEDNICNEMFDDVNTLLNTPSTKPENLEWYKIN